MDIENIKGFADQELLFRALLKFLSSQIDRSEQITTGLMKQSLTEWSEKTGMTVKEVKSLDETTRQKIVADMIDFFTDKIKHLVASKLQRDKLKNNALLIYEQWKTSHRQASSADVLSEIENLTEK